MNSLLCWAIDTLSTSAMNHVVMDNAVVFPALEMAHFVGLSVLFGSLLVVDLRIIGFAKHLPLDKVSLFLRFAVIGFVINFISGALFVIGDPGRYLVNIAFWLKMFTIGLAGLNTVFFILHVKPKLYRSFAGQQLTNRARLVAWLSLILWLIVIVLGRFIPYLETP